MNSGSIPTPSTDGIYRAVNGQAPTPEQEETPPTGKPAEAGVPQPRLLLASALKCAKRGWYVFSCWWIENGHCTCGKCGCDVCNRQRREAGQPESDCSPGKHPSGELAPRGVLDASIYPETIKRWWVRYPLANLALACGRSGLIVVDNDLRHGANEGAFWEKVGGKVDTVRTLTPSGGWHDWFSAPTGEFTVSVGKFLPGVDIRAGNGYAMLPPSNHLLGTYQFEIGFSPKEIQVAPCPPILADFARRRDAIADTSAGESTTNELTGFDLLRALAGVPEGERDDQIFRVACSFRGSNMKRELAIQLVSEAALKCDPPFSVARAIAKVHQAYSRYPAGNAKVEEGDEEPRPLRREPPPIIPFPLQNLPEVVKAAVEAIHEVTQAPISICGQSVLAAINLIAQSHFNVKLPTDEIKPVSEFFITIAESGERKTAADERALAAVRKWEADQRKEWDEAWRSHLDDLAAWEAQRRQILSDKKIYPDKADKQAALQRLGKTPEPPAMPLLLCSEPTYEGLVRLLRDGYGFAGVFTSEGGQFMGSHAMSAENRLRTIAGLSKIFDGLPIDRVRAGDGISSLYERRAALHLLLQPIIANQVFCDELLIGQGFLSRILSIMPELAAGSRPFRKPTPVEISRISNFSNGLLVLLKKKSAPKTVKDREIKSKVLTLSKDAYKAWTDYYDRIEAQVGAGGRLAPVRGLANKAPEHASRLAATLEGFKDPNANKVGKPLFDTATELVDFYLNEALRIYATIQDSADLKLAELTLEWLTKQWKEPAFSLRDIYQFGPYAIRDAEPAKRVVAILVEHGHIAPIEGIVVIKDIKRRQAYELVQSNTHGMVSANPANAANFPGNNDFVTGSKLAGLAGLADTVPPEKKLAHTPRTPMTRAISLARARITRVMFYDHRRRSVRSRAPRYYLWLRNGKVAAKPFSAVPDALAAAIRANKRELRVRLLERELELLFDAELVEVRGSAPEPPLPQPEFQPNEPTEGRLRSRWDRPALNEFGRCDICWDTAAIINQYGRFCGLKCFSIWKGESADEVLADAVTLNPVIEAELARIWPLAEALGWSHERLWNAHFWPNTPEHPRGLAAVLHPGDEPEPPDSVVEVARDYLVIERTEVSFVKTDGVITRHERKTWMRFPKDPTLALDPKGERPPSIE
jgi:hypothetical protein